MKSACAFILQTAVLLASPLLAKETDLPIVNSSTMYDPRYTNKRVRFSGRVTDVFNDEVDPHYTYLIAEDEHGTAYMAFNSKGKASDLNHLVGSRISTVGLCMLTTHITGHRFIGRMITVLPRDEITVVTPCNSDAFDVSELTDGDISLDTLSKLRRCRLSGHVLATRNGGRFLLQTKDGSISQVALRSRHLPKVGDAVEVAGNVETDLHHLNLARAEWRPAEPWPFTCSVPTNASARLLLQDEAGHSAIKRMFHGRPIRTIGIVRSLPVPGFNEKIFYVESDGVTFPVDVSHVTGGIPALEVGYKVQFDGICWFEIENWRPNAPFPQFKGFTLVSRTPEDIVVVGRPSWWTAGRLLGVVGALLAAVLALLGWNWALRKVAERRGRQFFREQVARMEAELKTAERSRLAVELHDSISQVLTGVALKIKAAQAMAHANLDRALENLAIAENTLRSSREELRNCLWDLRNNILDLPDFEEAVRRTLQPHTGEIELDVHFPIPRRKLSDNTAHVILQIVRELAVNAIRHGDAKSIKVTGAMDGRGIRFSVADDGRGFDPKNRIGALQGHYGLQGIHERLERLNGEMTIESEPGHGAKVTCTIVREEMEDHE